MAIPHRPDYFCAYPEGSPSGAARLSSFVHGTLTTLSPGLRSLQSSCSRVWYCFGNVGASGAHFSWLNVFLSDSGPMQNEWQDIVKLALEREIQQTGAAVSGAKLRRAIAEIASERGIEFPPPDMGKFSAFVESFAADVLVHRRPGNDILVVPSSRAELLTVENPSVAANAARIRQDLFEALTRIPAEGRGAPHYEPDQDTVIYVAPGGVVPSTAVALPVTSLENELQIRRQFIGESELQENAKEALAGALSNATPLRSFSGVVQAFGLIKQWHFFRMSKLSSKLRAWSVERALPWQSSWVDLSEPRSVAPIRAGLATTAVGRKKLADLATLLSDEDIARINIPMDIVLRLLSH